MPTNQFEVFVATLILLSGSLIIGILIGEFSSIMNDMGEKARKGNEEFDNLTSVMIGIRLPEEIQTDVLAYYEQLQNSKFVKNEQVYEYLNKCGTNAVKLFQVEEKIIGSNLIHESNQNLIR